MLSMLNICIHHRHIVVLMKCLSYGKNVLPKSRVFLKLLNFTSAPKTRLTALADMSTLKIPATS